MLVFRYTNGIINLNDLGLTHSNETQKAVIAKRSVIDGRPISKYKYRDLSEMRLRGEIWPVGDPPQQAWDNLIAYLTTAEDPVITLADVTDNVETLVGTFYITDWNLERPDLVNGIPTIQRWRLTLQEFQEGEPVTPIPSAGEGEGLPSEIVDQGTVI